MPTPFRILAVLLAAGPFPLPAQDPPPKGQNVALATTGLAGQPVAVLPLTMIMADRRVPGVAGTAARATLARWADSLLGDLLTERATEVNWILPPRLRLAAARAAGMMPSPDQMGQAVLRAPNLKEVPDPLRAHLRQLLTLAGGARFAFIPAALALAPAGAAGDSLQVSLSAVLADGRLGRVVWRTVAVGVGETADEAYRAALSTLFLPDSGGEEDGRTAGPQGGR